MKARASRAIQESAALVAHYQDLPGGSESALVALKSEPELKERNELVSREPGLTRMLLRVPRLRLCGETGP